MFSGHKNSDQIHLGAFHGSLVMLQITCYPDGETQVFLKSLKAHLIPSRAEGTKRLYSRLYVFSMHLGQIKKLWSWGIYKTGQSQIPPDYCS